MNLFILEEGDPTRLGNSKEGYSKIDYSPLHSNQN